MCACACACVKYTSTYVAFRSVEVDHDSKENAKRKGGVRDEKKQTLIASINTLRSTAEQFGKHVLLLHDVVSVPMQARVFLWQRTQ